MKIGSKPNVDAKMSGAVGVIAKTDPLIADSLPKEFGALDRNRAARQRNDAVYMDIGISKINGESGIVVLNHRTQQQRPFALEPEFVPGQKAGVVEIKPFGSGADDANVAIIIEDRESIAMFQGPQRPLDEGPLDFDIVLGQLDRRVRDIFYTARRRMRVITDVRSPRNALCRRRSRASRPATRLPRRTPVLDFVWDLSPQPAGFKTWPPPCCAIRSQASGETSRWAQAVW